MIQNTQMKAKYVYTIYGPAHGIYGPAHKFHINNLYYIIYRMLE